jgi:hypothetical protein
VQNLSLNFKKESAEFVKLAFSLLAGIYINKIAYPAGSLN